MNTRRIFRKLIPPIGIDVFQKLKETALHRPLHWEYMPQGWDSPDPAITGWDMESIALAERQKWPAFVQLQAEPQLLGINHEDRHPQNEHAGVHNTLMSFAYVVGAAALGEKHLSVLDWGGGLGHYYVFASSLFPGLQLDYHCRDLEPFCRHGAELLPQVTFHARDDEWTQKRFALVFASGALQYVRYWQETLQTLSAAAAEYLYLTRVPIVQDAASFVVLQRPYQLGYAAEYLGWVFNRGELVAAVSALGLRLVREFIVMENPVILHAPEQPHYRGFLFRR